VLDCGVWLSSFRLLCDWVHLGILGTRGGELATTTPDWPSLIDGKSAGALSVSSYEAGRAATPGAAAGGARRSGVAAV
jgi:hypothetical protein